LRDLNCLLLLSSVPRNSVFKKLFGEGLASIKDYKTWRAHRTLLRPVFQKGGIDSHQDQIHHILRKRLQAILRGSQINISAVCREATFAVMFKLVFQSHSSSDLFQQALAALNELNRTFVFADLERYLQDTIASWIPAPNRQKCQRLIAHVHQVTEALFKNAKPGEGGVLETIVQSNLYDHKSMLDEALVLLFGGYDTTSISLQRAFLQLDKHPSEWPTLRSMVKMHFKRDDPVGSVGSGPLRDYLDALVHEVMRLDPASPMHVRHSVRATELNGFAIPENQDAFINSVSIMRNKDIWGADADEFKPSRWLEGSNRTQLEKYWIPFGGGQRICIGNYLSMTEQYYFLANLADMFESVSIPRDPTLHDVQGITNGFSKDIWDFQLIEKLQRKNSKSGYTRHR
jgi:cytochrome P450